MKACFCVPSYARKEKVIRLIETWAGECSDISMVIMLQGYIDGDRLEIENFAKEFSELDLKLFFVPEYKDVCMIKIREDISFLYCQEYDIHIWIDDDFEFLEDSFLPYSNAISFLEQNNNFFAVQIEKGKKDIDPREITNEDRVRVSCGIVFRKYEGRIYDGECIEMTAEEKILFLHAITSGFLWAISFSSRMRFNGKGNGNKADGGIDEFLSSKKGRSVRRSGKNAGEFMKRKFGAPLFYGKGWSLPKQVVDRAYAEYTKRFGAGDKE